jgi:hypothetical protein
VFEPLDARTDDGSGVREDLVLKPSARHLRPVQAEVDGTDEELVPVQELLAWRSPEPSVSTHVAAGRLAALLGVAALAVVVMMLILAASTDVTTVFGRLSGS